MSKPSEQTKQTQWGIWVENKPFSWFYVDTADISALNAISENH